MLYEELGENDKRKDEFLAMLAHELRNPLAAVGNAITVLKYSERPGACQDSPRMSSNGKCDNSSAD